MSAPMTNAIEVTIQPVGDAALPECALSGINGDLPTITWHGDATHARVTLMLGNHVDPAKYLRDLAEQLQTFAALVDVAAPVPYALAEGVRL